MKSCYKYDLLQASKEQGYFKGGLKKFDPFKDSVAIPEHFPTTYENKSFKNEVSFGKIIVERMPNEFIAREIITGAYIQVVYFGTDRINSFNYGIFAQNSLFDKYNTFIRIFSRLDKKGNPELTDRNSNFVTLEEIEEYKKAHADVNAYAREMLAFFQQGEKNMKDKIEEEKRLKKENGIIRRLFKRG